MSEVQQITVTKDQLLSNFSALTQWLKQYWYFLEHFPLDVFADDGQIIEHLREYIADLEDELEWDKSFQTTQNKLVEVTRLAKQQIAQGKAQAMDYDKL